MDERTIFDRALDLSDPCQRAAFLQWACGEDAELRSRVEALLRSHEVEDSFLQGVAGQAAVTGLDRISEQPGAVIGRYKLLEQVGEGGFGVVFMAEQTEPVRRKVALKVIKPGMDTKEVIARFEAERQALAIMDHPHIARVLDGGATGSDRPYFVMELVRGIPITDYCDQNNLTARERLELFHSVCQAVQHAHQKGIIHRDIKPSNVLVTLHDDKPVPKVIDFGVAKATNVRLTERTLFTRFYEMVGTPLYMSPEQAQLSGLDVDTRSDIYSLGVLLYELLTGTTPFDQRRIREAAYDEMLRIIREEEPPRPSTRVSTLGAAATTSSTHRRTDPKRLSQSLRGELDWIVMKALEKDRSRRYETTGALAADIEHYLNDEAVMACPPSAAYRVRKFARRNKTVIATTIAVVVSLAVGTSLAVLQAIRAAHDRDRALAAEELAERRLESEHTAHAQARRSEMTAREQAARAEGEAAIAAAINQFLQNDLLAQASPDLEPDRDIRLRTVLDRAAQNIERRFENQPTVEAGIRHVIGATYLSLGEFTQAEPHLKRALELRREHFGPEHPDTLTSMNNLAVLYENLGDYGQAESLLIETLEARRRVLGEEHPQTLTTMSNLATTYLLCGEPKQCELLLVDALQTQRRVLGPEHPDTLASTTTLAGLHKRRKQYAEAAALIAGTLEIRRRTLGPEHPRTLDSINNLALVFERQGRFAEAETLFLEVLATRQRVLGEEHPRTLVSLDNLAQLYQTTGRYAEADELLNEYLLIMRRRLPVDDLALAEVLTRLGSVKLALHEFDAAEPILRESLSICEADEPDDWLTCRTKGMLGAVLLRRHRCSEAEPLLADALTICRRILGEEHPYTLDTLNHLALCYLADGEYAAAEPLFVEALAGRRRVLGEDHPRTLTSMEILAQLYQAMGRFDEAGNLLEELRARAPHRSPVGTPAFDGILERLVTFYESRAAAGDAERAEKYRTLLESR